MKPTRRVKQYPHDAPTLRDRPILHGKAISVLVLCLLGLLFHCGLYLSAGKRIRAARVDMEMARVSNSLDRVGMALFDRSVAVAEQKTAGNCILFWAAGFVVVGCAREMDRRND